MYLQISAQKFEEFECVAIDNFISLHAVLNYRGQGVMSSGKTHSFDFVLVIFRKVMKGFQFPLKADIRFL